MGLCRPMTLETPASSLPDIAAEMATQYLDWVGMKEVEVLVLLDGSAGRFRQAARADAQVSLDRGAHRGIHMSRLYLLVQEGLGSHPLNFELLRGLVTEFLKTHEELSSSARLEVRLPWPLLRRALKSGNQAWRTYPVTISCEIHGDDVSFYLEALVTYSSTCPASAALARQLIQQNFERHFSQREIDFDEVSQWLGRPEGIIATPHAQRSEAKVKVRVGLNSSIGAESLIDMIEHALQTPVQGAVKREDEQEFALRNGQNLMFCEDAARRVKSALDQQTEIIDYVAELNHIESLHPHNAVARVSKGLRLR